MWYKSQQQQLASRPQTLRHWDYYTLRNASNNVIHLQRIFIIRAPLIHHHIGRSAKNERKAAVCFLSLPFFFLPYLYLTLSYPLPPFFDMFFLYYCVILSSFPFSFSLPALPSSFSFILLFALYLLLFTLPPLPPYQSLPHVSTNGTVILNLLEVSSSINTAAEVQKMLFCSTYLTEKVWLDWVLA